MHPRWDARKHRAFRWSRRKIREVSLASGMWVGLGLATLIAIEAVRGSPVMGRLEFFLIGAGIAVAGGILCCLLVWAMLAIARASTGTIVFPDGLLIRQALWQTRFIAWGEIADAELRAPTGWRYLFLRSASRGPELGMTVEVDDPEELAQAIQAAAPSDSPLRKHFGRS